MSEPTKPSTPPAAADSATDQPADPAASGAPNEQAEPRPAEEFKRGLGLLWKAARSAADEIQTEVKKAGVSDSLRQAGRDLEQAANQAARTLESFIDRVGPSEPPAQGWPGPPDPPAKAPPAADPPAAETPAEPPAKKPAEGGEMRIQIDDDADA